jgi:hypothetical protein
MSFVVAYRNHGALSDRLRDAQAVTAELMSAVIVEACRRMPPRDANTIYIPVCCDNFM